MLCAGGRFSKINDQKDEKQAKPSKSSPKNIVGREIRTARNGVDITQDRSEVQDKQNGGE